MTGSIGPIVAIRSGDGRSGGRGTTGCPAVEGSWAGVDHRPPALQRRPHRPLPLRGRADQLVVAGGGGRGARQPAPGPAPLLQAGPRPLRRAAGHAARQGRAAARPAAGRGPPLPAPPVQGRRPVQAARHLHGRAGALRGRDHRRLVAPRHRRAGGQGPPRPLLPGQLAALAAATGQGVGGHGGRDHGPAGGVRPQRPGAVAGAAESPVPQTSASGAVAGGGGGGTRPPGSSAASSQPPTPTGGFPIVTGVGGLIQSINPISTSDTTPPAGPSGVAGVPAPSGTSPPPTTNPPGTNPPPTSGPPTTTPPTTAPPTTAPPTTDPPTTAPPTTEPPTTAPPTTAAPTTAAPTTAGTTAAPTT